MIFKSENKKKNFFERIASLTRKMRRSKIAISITYIIVFIFGLLVRPITDKSIEFYTQKHLTQKKLTYEIIKTAKYKKYELIKLQEEEGLSEFNLNLDDPILRYYYFVKIRLRNEGEFIQGPIRLNTLCDYKYTKIIDIKYKVHKPSHKIIKIAHSLPSLTWNMENKDLMRLSWDYPDLSSVDGFYIFHSRDRDVGYGRINEKILTKTIYKLPIDKSKDFSTHYFRITAVGVWGETELSDEFFKTPDMLAFSSYFKDVYWINPEITSTNKSNGSRSEPFHSIEKAVTKINKSAIFIVDQYRDNITSIQNVSNEVKVYYKDDLEFLKGKIELSILSGLDENAEIDLVFLCKTISFKPLNMGIKLIGSPDITFEKKLKKSLNNSYSQPTNRNQEKFKKLLTPKIVKTYLGKNTIYLAWEIPKSPQYKGVRIFRSGMRNISDFENLGEEIYDGPGYLGETLQCIYHQREKIAHDEIKSIWFEHDYGPPPKNIHEENLRPSKPKGMRIINEYEVKSPFFEDCNVVPKVTYTYTLYFYDNDDKYSYPILIIASLDDWSAMYLFTWKWIQIM